MVLGLTYDGKHLTVTKRTKPKDVILAFGNPTDSWDDDIEKCLTYEPKGRTLRFTFVVRHLFFKPAGRLKIVEVELSDENRNAQTC